MTDQPAPSIAPTQPSRWFTIRFAKCCWRLISQPLRWFRRHFWKLCIWFITLITLAWQYENWHGRRALEEQRALWIQEYGEMKMSDFIEPSVPDETNFFAAPVFEKFVVNRGPRDIGPNERPFETAHRKALEAMPHGRFLQLRFPELKPIPGEIKEVTLTPGVTSIDAPAWAANEVKLGHKRPPGLSDAQWLYQSLPQEEILRDLIAALNRPNSVMLPDNAERFAVGNALDDPAAVPIQALSQIHAFASNITLRAKAAASAGRLEEFMALCEVLIRFCHSGGNSTSLVSFLTITPIEQVTLQATSVGIATGVASDESLRKLTTLLTHIDEERMLRNSLTWEGFGLHIWSVDKIRTWHHRFLPPLKYLPEGWIDANMANHLSWWREIILPRTNADDLLAFTQKMDAGFQKMRVSLSATPNPRTLLAAVACPALSGIGNTALQLQTRRRQLLLAIAAERFILKYQHPPTNASELVPEFLPAIPGDPYAPGQPLQLTEGEPNERYRILSIGPETTLAFPR